ncbi:sugar transporter ERD6-like 7 [Aricia agestis]|uniref:sugar transporter ERD6-like 7 n=1 Tax=Aricia agestis TaxID=91739 RepID=UPI001C202C6F|nr:sugar transporter ERD6-like 7 [Aricia agestis]
MAIASPALKQTWIFMGVFFNDISQGMVISFPSIMQTALLASDSDVKVDLNTASWIASVIGIGAMIGFGTSSFLMELYGRKLTYILYLSLGVIGWLCLYFGTNVPVLVIGRLLGGVSSSSTTSVGSVVLGEYTSPKHRGTFLNLKAATLCLGNLALHLIGQFLYWRTVTLIAIGSAAVALLIVLTWPESPSWFASVKRFKDCEKTFYWLRGRNADSDQELKEMVIAQKERLVTPYMLEGISVHGTFASFGGVMFLALIALWFVLPETKDKTLQEIENYFNHGKYNVVECDHIMAER